MSNVKIKICGMTCDEDIESVNEYRPEYVGFVLFFSKSKRNIEIVEARRLIAHLAEGIKTVAVVVSPKLDWVEQICQVGFDFIQIHGNLSKEVLDNCSIPIIKAFNVSDLENLEKYRDIDNITGFVFDASTPGSGKTFDWNILNNIECKDKLMFLSGGLGPENVSEAIKKVNPDVVDVSSGVEYSEKSGKDPEKIREFIKAARG